MKPLSILLTAYVVTGLGQTFAQDAKFAPKIYATRADGGPAWELATLTDYACVSSPELSPDGLRVAFNGRKNGENGSDRHIFVINLNDEVIEDLGRGALPNWSADGAWLAYTNCGPNRGVYIRPVFGGTDELIDADGSAIRWSPDGKRLAYVRGGNLIIYDPATMTRRAVFPENEPLPYERISPICRWSPDSRHICFKGLRQSVTGRQRTVYLTWTKRQDEIAVVTVDGEPQLTTCCDAADAAEDIAWHPDGSRIVISKGGQLYEFNSHANDSLHLLRGLPAGRTTAGMCWSRDGQILVFVSCGPQPQPAVPGPDPRGRPI